MYKLIWNTFGALILISQNSQEMVADALGRDEATVRVDGGNGDVVGCLGVSQAFGDLVFNSNGFPARLGRLFHFLGDVSEISQRLQSDYHLGGLGVLLGLVERAGRLALVVNQVHDELSRCKKIWKISTTQSINQSIGALT